MALVYDPRTGKLVDDGSYVPGNPARAAAMQAQFDQPVIGPRTVVQPVQPPVLAGTGTVDRGPARSQPAPTGNNPTRAAAMQAQFDQPVTGPRTAAPPAAPLSYPEIPEFNTSVAAPAATPVAPAAPTSAVNPNAINVGGALGQAYLGGMAAVPATVLDAARRGVTSLVGGDVNSLPGGPTALGDRAFGAMDQGLSQFGQANANLWSNLQEAGRNALGVQAAPAAQPPVVAPPVAAPTTAPVTAAAPTVADVTQQPDMLTAADVGRINASIAENLQALRPEQGIMQPAVRGDYNMTNTPRGTGAPANNGINFGFGANGNETARQYLDRMQLQDAQNAMGRRANVVNAEIQAIQSGLSNRSSVGELVAARQRIAALQPISLAAQQGRTQLLDRAAQGQTALQTQQLENVGGVQAADAAGQARVAGAQATAAGTMTAAQIRAQGLLEQERLRQQSPEQQRAASETQLLDLQTQAVLEMLASGAPAQDVIAGTRRGQPQAPAPYVADPMGIPLYRVAPDGTIQLVDPADAARVRAIANPRAGQ